MPSTEPSPRSGRASGGARGAGHGGSWHACRLTSVSLTGPEPISTNPLRRVAFELQTERRARGGYPPGDTSLSVRRTHRMIADPLHLLLDAYERHGPVFSLRILNARNVFMLGPEANHFMLVSHADRFRWRDGGFGDLIPLLGDGMLTIDGDFHKQSRRIMLPAFHHERVKAALGVMDEEIERALRGWHDGLELDLYGWARELALRVAMRALFGFDADSSGPARDFERALGFYGREYWLQVLRGPRTPWAQLQSSRERLDRADLRRDRRPAPHRAPRRGRAVAAARRAVQRSPHPRPRDDAAVRGPRHHHRHGRVPVLRARPPPGDRRRRRPAAARPGARRDAAPLPAGLDRPAPRRPRVRLRRPPRRRGRGGQLLLVGVAPAARRVGGAARASAPSASHPRRASASPRAPTSRSAAAPGSASGCASARPRSAPSRPP